MAIALDTTTSGSTTGASSLTVAMTVSGSDRYLYVMAVSVNVGLVDATSCTYPVSGSPASGTRQWTADRGATQRAEAFGLKNPDTGSNNIVVTYSSSRSAIRLVAGSYTGVDQTTAERAASTATGSSTTPSVSITNSVTNDVVVDGVVAGNTISSSGNNIRQNVFTGPTLGYSDAAGTGANTMSYTLSGSTSWAIGAFAIIPVATATGWGPLLCYAHNRMVVEG